MIRAALLGALLLALGLPSMAAAQDTSLGLGRRLDRPLRLPFLDETKDSIEHDDNKDGDSIVNFTKGDRDGGGNKQNGDKHIEKLAAKDHVPGNFIGNHQGVRSMLLQAAGGFLAGQTLAPMRV